MLAQELREFHAFFDCVGEDQRGIGLRVEQSMLETFGYGEEFVGGEGVLAALSQVTRFVVVVWVVKGGFCELWRGIEVAHGLYDRVDPVCLLQGTSMARKGACIPVVLLTTV